MVLSREEAAWIDKRAKLAASWPIVGSISLVMVLAVAGWIWVKMPMLVNPWEVVSGLDSGSIPDTTISLMAALLPVAILMYLFVMVAALLLSFTAFSNERKLIAIVRRLTGGAPS